MRVTTRNPDAAVHRYIDRHGAPPDYYCPVHEQLYGFHQRCYSGRIQQVGFKPSRFACPTGQIIGDDA